MRLRPDRASVLLTLAAVLHSWAVITLTPAWGLTTHAMIAAASGAIALCCRWGLRRLRLQHRRRRWAGSLPEALLVLGSLLRAHRVPERAIGTVAATAPAILTPTLARAEHAPHTDGGSVLAALQEALSAQAWTHPVCAQLRAAVDRADPGGFDRAERQVLAAERDRLHTAADRLQTQLTAVFLLGVFGPLAAVGLLPAASAGGLAVAPPTVAVIYHLWVPLGLLTGVLLIIVGPVGALHPPAPLEVPMGGLPRALLVGVSAGAAAGLVGHQVVPWAGPHLAVAVGVGVTAHVQTAPHLAGSHARTAIHTALPDLMATLAAALTAGGAPERAIAAAAAATPMGRVCMRVDTRLRAGASLSDALAAAVATAPTTPRLQRWAVHYRVAAGLGTAGGPLCASVAGAWRAADAVRTEALHRLGGLIRMCTHTGVVIGPIIAGTTVAMLGALTETTLTGRPLTPQAAGPPVASTVLTIALLLPALGVLLERGRVGAVVVRQAGHAVALAMVIFTITVHLVGRLI
jgi:hypothetical protein